MELILVVMYGFIKYLNINVVFKGVVRLCNFCVNQINTRNGEGHGIRGKSKYFILIDY
jgi:hypothetical protein